MTALASVAHPDSRGTRGARTVSHVAAWIRVRVAARLRPSARPARPSRKPIRLAYLFSDGNMPGTLKAFKALLAGAARSARPRGAHASSPSRCCRRRERRRDLTRAERAGAGHDEPADARAVQRDAQGRSDRQRARRRGKVLRASAKGCCRRRPTSSRARSGTSGRARYWAHMGFANQLGAAEVRADAGRRHAAWRFPTPQPSLDFGYYYPAT